MSVLLYDPIKKTHMLEMRNGPWAGKRWSVDLGVCDNPCCGCFRIDFECIPEDATWYPHAASACFALDAEKHSIYRDAGRKSPAISDSLAQTVVDELADAGWKYLYEFLLGAKQEQLKN